MNTREWYEAVGKWNCALSNALLQGNSVILLFHFILYFLAAMHLEKRNSRFKRLVTKTFKVLLCMAALWVSCGFRRKKILAFKE